MLVTRTYVMRAIYHSYISCALRKIQHFSPGCDCPNSRTSVLEIDVHDIGCQNSGPERPLAKIILQDGEQFLNVPIKEFSVNPRENTCNISMTAPAHVLMSLIAVILVISHPWLSIIDDLRPETNRPIQQVKPRRYIHCRQRYIWYHMLIRKQYISESWTSDTDCQ